MSIFLLRHLLAYDSQSSYKDTEKKEAVQNGQPQSSILYTL